MCAVRSKSRKRNQRRRGTSQSRLLNVSARSRGGWRQVAWGRWIGWGLVGLLVVLAAVIYCRFDWLAARVFSNNELFVLRRVEITTDGHLGAGEIKEYAGVAEGMPLFAMSPKDIRDNLLKVSVVENARVGRLLPDTLLIEVSERVAIARLGRAGRAGPLSIDSTGHVLGPSMRAAGLPIISGLRDKGLLPGGRVEDPRLDDALKILDVTMRVDMYPALQVRVINLDDPEVIDIGLASGERVLLLNEDIELSMVNLAMMLDAAKKKGLRMAEYDLTVKKNIPARM